MSEKFKKPQKISGEDLDSIIRTDEILNDIADAQYKYATGMTHEAFADTQNVDQKLAQALGQVSCDQQDR